MKEQVIMFTNVSEEEQELLCGIVPCILISPKTMLVPIDVIDDLVEEDENGDDVYINGLSGKVVTL